MCSVCLIIHKLKKKYILPSSYFLYYTKFPTRLKRNKLKNLYRKIYLSIELSYMAPILLYGSEPYHEQSAD